MKNIIVAVGLVFLIFLELASGCHTGPIDNCSPGGGHDNHGPVHDDHKDHGHDNHGPVHDDHKDHGHDNHGKK